MVTNGSITLNGISDQELVQLLGIKIKHEASFTLASELPQAGQGLYENVVFRWYGQDGLAALREAVAVLSGTAAKAATQAL